MPATNTSLLLILTVLAMEAVVLVLTILYRHQLFKMSLDFILDYQAR